jgi:hemoglobin
MPTDRCSRSRFDIRNWPPRSRDLFSNISTTTATSSPKKGRNHVTGYFDFHHETKRGRRPDARPWTGGVLAADKAHAQTKQTAPEKSLCERLGGVFAIAVVVDHFSDAVVKNPIVGQKSKNARLREWHTKNLGRLPGLKFMRTQWVCNVSGGPYQFTATNPGTTPLGLEEAHRDLRISPAEFDEVAAELGRTLDFVKVPTREKDEVLAAFAAHKGEVTAGYVAVHKGG